MIPMLAMAGQGGAQGQGSAMAMLLPMVIIFAIFYFMLIRPQQRKDKQRRELINNLESGARIMFSGGIIGVVTNVKEHTFIVKVSDNTKIEIAKGAVNRVLDKDEKPEVEERA